MDKYRFSIKSKEEYAREFAANGSLEQKYRDFWDCMGSTLWKQGAKLAKKYGEKVEETTVRNSAVFDNFADQYVDYRAFELPKEEGAALLTLLKFATSGKRSYKEPRLPFNVELITRIV